MNRSFDLEVLDRITAGAVGAPGERTFFVQATAGETEVTLLAEKQQVAMLAQALLQLVSSLPDGGEEGEDPTEADLELREPLDAEWRVGEIELGYNEQSERLELRLTEFQPEEEETEEEPARARFALTKAQARALATHAFTVVAAGRPRCQLCGNPIESDGHVCPSMNGHRQPRA